MHFTHGKDEPLPVKIAPRPDNQHVGHLAIAATGLLTVSLYDGGGTVLWQKSLEPEGVPA